MSSPVNVTFNDLGIINGYHTVEVINADTGETIGVNQTPVEDDAV